MSATARIGNGGVPMESVIRYSPRLLNTVDWTDEASAEEKCAAARLMERRKELIKRCEWVSEGL